MRQNQDDPFEKWAKEILSGFEQTTGCSILDPDGRDVSNTVSGKVGYVQQAIAEELRKAYFYGMKFREEKP